ncbi:MAG: hypothetical protein OEW58_06845 [Gammaproteobacteria bacterium]|nr:hypothetical protein [Gammaproteobacteria bacterium]
MSSEKSIWPYLAGIIVAIGGLVGVINQVIKDNSSDDQPKNAVAAVSSSPSAPPTSSSSTSSLPKSQAPTKPEQAVITLSTSSFKKSSDEWSLDVRSLYLPKLRSKQGEGLDLSKYNLEFTFQGAGDKQVQLWFRNADWKNVYSDAHTTIDNSPITFDPSRDPRAVNQFNDFSNIFQVGVKVFDEIGDTQLVAAKLTPRKT